MRKGEQSLTYRFCLIFKIRLTGDYRFVPFHAVSIFYEMRVSDNDKMSALNIKKEDISIGKTELRKTHR